MFQLFRKTNQKIRWCSTKIGNSRKANVFIKRCLSTQIFTFNKGIRLATFSLETRRKFQFNSKLTNLITFRSNLIVLRESPHKIHFNKTGDILHTHAYFGIDSVEVLQVAVGIIDIEINLIGRTDFAIQNLAMHKTTQA